MKRLAQRVNVFKERFGVWIKKSHLGLQMALSYTLWQGGDCPATLCPTPAVESALSVSVRQLPAGGFHALAELRLHAGAANYSVKHAAVDAA